MKIVTIIGARPQFIKAATVSRVIASRVDVQEVLVHTGQHYDANMSDVFFSELGISHPDFNLGVSGGDHGQQTGQMLIGIEEVLKREKPDWVLVYGDTNSTLAGALAAVKLHIPVAHVEAGLRSFNRKMPEEVNRVLTDHSSEILFAPTDVAVKNLTAEGIPVGKVHNVGDVMYDAALFYGAKADRQSNILDRLQLESKGYILSTIHRAENTDDAGRLKTIFEALGQVANLCPVVLPLHPRTRKKLECMGMLSEVEQKIMLIPPLGYLDMVMLEKNAKLVVTDSGGVQKEAFFYNIPCVTLRNETEWVELIELGWNILVPPVSVGAILENIKESLSKPSGVSAMPYGEGDSADRVVEKLMSY